MSALLEIVHEARELRDAAEREWRRALSRAREGGATWAQIAAAGGLTRAGARFLVRRERGEIDGHGRKTLPDNPGEEQ